jgi:hypothetical protein
MRPWTPRTLYEAKPWVMIVAGVLLAAGATVWSIIEGYWTVFSCLSMLAGAALAIIGGVVLQMRQDYRARSKWRRETSR